METNLYRPDNPTLASFGTILCSVPGQCWDTKPPAGFLPTQQDAAAIKHRQSIELLQRFIQELQVIERRLRKGDLSGDESGRYSRLCSRIEETALVHTRHFTFRSRRFFVPRVYHFRGLRIGRGYTDFLHAAKIEQPESYTDPRGRLGSSIQSPQQVQYHRNFLPKWIDALDFRDNPAIQDRLWFLDHHVIKKGCGLIEVPDVMSPSIPRSDAEQTPEEEFASHPPSASSHERTPAVRTSAHPEITDWQQYGTSDRGGFMKNRLRTQINNAMQSGTVVNLMNQRQNMAIETLQEYIHLRDGQAPSSIPVTYLDGGEPEPLLLHGVPHLPDGWQPTRDYHIGLVSMRHLPIDRYVDINWYRNVEVPATNGLSSADDHCYRVSLTQIQELLNLNPDDRIRIYLYHSGYMPAVIGFYRALLTTLAQAGGGNGRLQVIPKLQPNNQGGFVEGRPWPE